MAAAALAIAVTAGCRTSPVPHKGLSGPLNPLATKSKQEALRKAVESDPFPTAAQVGL